MNTDQMNTCLSYFVMEVRKKDAWYRISGKSQYSIIIAILRHLKESECLFNFLDYKDKRFIKFRYDINITLSCCWYNSTFDISSCWIFLINFCFEQVFLKLCWSILDARMKHLHSSGLVLVRNTQIL